MKKKLILEFDQGLNPKYKKWAKEATEQFISLFPEFKDSLSVSISKNKSFYTAQEVEDIVKRSLKANPNIDKQEIYKHFILQPDGTFLHDDSIHAHILRSVDENGRVDLQKWLHEKDHHETTISLDQPITISITPRLTQMGYGISNIVGPCISAGACENLMKGSADEELYFKEILMHELGHSFNATHLERSNILDDKILGTHCSDQDCLMYLHAYLTERFNARKAQHKENPFCDDCMTAMRECMQNVLKLDRSKSQELQSINTQKQNNLANIPYFANLSSEETKLLEAYAKYLADNNISRDDKDMFFDKMYLIADMRSQTNQSGQTPKSFLSPDTFDFKHYCNSNWNEPLHLKALRTKIYEEKKYVKYSTDLWDGKTPAKKDKDGKIAYFAAAGQTPKGDELAKRMLDTMDMKTQGDFLSSGWIFRLPPSLKNSNVVQRFAVNALPDEKLFDALDDFARKHNAYYKTATPHGWHRRNDPVVIYCTQTPDKATIDELKTIVAPYIRREKPDRMNDLDGTLIADGLITAQEPSLEEIKKLFDEIKTYHPALAEALKLEIKNGNNPHNPLSLGQFEAYKKILENYKQAFKPLQKLNVNQGQDNTNTLESTPNTPQDKSFKKAWREIFQPSAARQKAEYKEDIKATEYSAEIKHANGSVDKIVATNAHNITLSAKDKDGNPKTPNMQRFRDIVAYAKKQGSAIEFGDIKSPDFKARLMLACMEEKPAMEMVGAPELNDAFLQGIQDEKLKGALQIMKNKLQTQQQSKPQQNQQEVTPAPEPNTSTPQTEYEKSCETRRRSLEAKEKLGKISKMEKAELDYIRADILKEIELKKAKAKYNSEDPRFEEHKQKSGLKIENYYYSSKTRTSDADWKLHLDVVPNRNHPTTKAISEMLEKLDIEHKIAKGGENGKGMTIYVGNYADTLRLSKEINARFGKEIEQSPCYVDQNLSEHYFNPKVSGRFWMQNIFRTQYPRSSIFGICPATWTKNGEMNIDEGVYKLFDLGQKNGIIPAEDKFSDCSYDITFFSNGDFHKSYVFHNFEAYCSHKLYEKELGEFYCGKNTDKFEKDFFEDKIPEKGAPERANWDKAAQEYVSFIENTHPNIIQMMKQEAQKYHSVDFSKLPPMPQNTQTRRGGRSA